MEVYNLSRREYISLPMSAVTGWCAGDRFMMCYQGRFYSLSGRTLRVSKFSSVCDSSGIGVCPRAPMHCSRRSRLDGTTTLRPIVLLDRMNAVCDSEVHSEGDLGGLLFG
jgi:hypothetical protein